MSVGIAYVATQNKDKQGRSTQNDCRQQRAFSAQTILSFHCAIFGRRRESSALVARVRVMAAPRFGSRSDF